jgi:hypothetical protein
VTHHTHHLARADAVLLLNEAGTLSANGTPAEILGLEPAAGHGSGNGNGNGDRHVCGNGKARASPEVGKEGGKDGQQAPGHPDSKAAVDKASADLNLSSAPYPDARGPEQDGPNGAAGGCGEARSKPGAGGQQQGKGGASETGTTAAGQKENAPVPDGRSRRLILDEERETGFVKGSVWSTYATALGAGALLALLVAYTVGQALTMGSSFWLTQWAADTLHQVSAGDQGVELRVGGGGVGGIGVGVWGCHDGRSLLACALGCCTRWEHGRRSCGVGVWGLGCGAYLLRR